MLTCTVVERHLTVDPYCGLPADPQSLKTAGQALCPDHLTDWYHKELGNGG